MSRKPGLFKQLIIGLFLFAGLSACTPPNVVTGPDGGLNILTLPLNFNVDDLPDGWFLAGSAEARQLAPDRKNPYTELRVSSGQEGFAVGRRTDASLLTTPYLSWRWNPQPGKWRHHPVRILIGFNNGGPKPAKRQGIARVFPNLGQPPHDRGLSIVWGPSALMRGTLIHLNAPDSTRKEAYYTVRGGQENAGVWWKETIDLSSLYAKAWPEDDPSQAQIVFIGIGTAKSNQPETSYIGDIRLSR